MSSRSIRRWIWWLLPFWVARAFVPTGFMLSSGADGLQLVLCPGSGPVPAFHSSPDAAAEQHHAADHTGHHKDHQGAGNGAHDNSPCAFALATSACAGSVTHVAAIAHAAVTQKAISYSNPPVDVRTDPIDRIRGPPHSV